MAATAGLSLTLDPMGKVSHGGHLEFPIGKRFTSLVQDHPSSLVSIVQVVSKKKRFETFSP
jgi:hypothetical protein